MTQSKSSSTAHKSVQHSSTLNRKYVKRPTAAKTLEKRGHLPAPEAAVAVKVAKTANSTPDTPPTPHPLQKSANAKKSPKTATAAQPTAKELKDRAIEQALRSVSLPETESPKTKSKKSRKSSDRTKRVVVAFACALACVATLVAVVNLNMPDISVRVAALQTGIEASYPSYVPRDYSLSNVSSEEGKITMNFAGPDNASFTLTEEKSSWDSTALLNNYVKPTWGDDYIVTREQGVTIYISNSDAAWVNGGVLFTIESEGTPLTKKQLRNIAISL